MRMRFWARLIKNRKQLDVKYSNFNVYWNIGWGYLHTVFTPSMIRRPQIHNTRRAVYLPGGVIRFSEFVSNFSSLCSLFLGFQVVPWSDMILNLYMCLLWWRNYSSLDCLWTSGSFKMKPQKEEKQAQKTSSIKVGKGESPQLAVSEIQVWFWVRSGSKRWQINA